MQAWFEREQKFLKDLTGVNIIIGNGYGSLRYRKCNGVPAKEIAVLNGL
jgi:hypothetical protein